MSYLYDGNKKLYIISLEGITDEKEYQGLLNEITIIEMSRGNNIYYTFYDSECKYCIIDFHKRMYTKEEIDSIIEENFGFKK